jgi:zinc protease
MIKSFLFALLAGCALQATAGVKISHWTSPSGAAVVFVERHDLPILDLQIDFTAGSALDPAGKSGLASLARGLMDAGTAELDEEQIAGRWVDLGARLSGSGDMDRSSFVLRTLASKPERDGAITLLRTLLSQPTYPESVLLREKARSVAGIQEAETRPDAIAARRFEAAIYPGHAYGRMPSVESVSAIRREDVLAFHRQHYSAKNAVVSLIGDLTRAEAEAIAQHLTDALPAGGDFPCPARRGSPATADDTHPASGKPEPYLDGPAQSASRRSGFLPAAGG